MKKSCPQCNTRIGIKSSFSLFIGLLKSCPVCGTKIGFETTAKFQVLYQNAFTLITAGSVVIFRHNPLFLILAIPIIILLMFAVQSYYSKITIITPEEAFRGKDITVFDFLKECLYFPLRIVPIPLVIYTFIQDQNIDWFFYLGVTLAMVIGYYWIWRDLKSGRTTLIKTKFKSDV